MAVDTFGIGQMRSVVVFQINQPVDNTSGGQDDNYVTTVTTRGWLTMKSGKKGIEAGSLQFGKSYTLYCRYQSDILLNSDTRVIVDGQAYQIDDWGLQDEIKHLYVLILNRVDG
jgi:SPP1 family predicted phage head-tail adaptor